MPTGQHCLIRMRVILSRREGRPVIKPDCGDPASPSHDGGDHEPPLNRGSPTALFVRAVGACHAEQLGAVLYEESLPWTAIEIQADAACTAVPSAPCLDTITVYPTIFGGDPNMHNQYTEAAKQARDRSLIGRIIRGNVAYKVGAVTVVVDGAPGALAPC